MLPILEPWHPYAGLVYFHLLLDGLADRGALDGTAGTSSPMRLS